MLLSRNNLGVVAAIVVGVFGVGEDAHGQCVAPRCSSPLGEPCAPERITYGYFPTTWRRWPTQRVEEAPERQPEPTPAEKPAEAAPAGPRAPSEPEVPVPAEPVPDLGPPKPPDVEPMEPPFGAGPLKPPTEEAPFMPPFNDAPPKLPDAGQDALPFDPTVPPSATPPEKPTEPPSQPESAAPPDGDLPPTMPDDDPFKDEPEGEAAPPAGAPKSSERTRADIMQVAQPANERWRIEGATPPATIHSPEELPIADNEEPRRLDAVGEMDEPAALPGTALRANPLRSASHQSRPRANAARPHPIVPAASFTAAETARADADGARWRRNPLR